MGGSLPANHLEGKALRDAGVGCKGKMEYWKNGIMGL
jgi:hypothetical protein